ncbi:MAG TPA: hypothetical protein VGK74_16095 [Symbiobacteriaceae bacterium]|jgi:uncharacterized membrane protein YgdD (TMEM256/DUF423 family)
MRKKHWCEKLGFLTAITGGIIFFVGGLGRLVDWQSEVWALAVPLGLSVLLIGFLLLKTGENLRRFNEKLTTKQIPDDI